MRLPSWPLAVLLASCDGGTDDTAPQDTSPQDDTGELTSRCPEPTPPPCTDAMVLDLSLHDDAVSDGAVNTTSEGDDRLTVVDATAGGFGQDHEHPWVYIRFDTDGAHRVDIDDEAALESLEWHLALRRSQLRLNGGDGGPSCVGADARTTSAYADIATVPADAEFQLEDFYTDACELQMEPYGLYPAYVLGAWWSYGSCVETTLTPYLVQLDDGRILKLVVEAYYATGQEACNASGTPGTDSGTITLRWAFLH
ncbi:MAG: HmuY family protein [Deltaproteobacteria bacterium]|nr:HmuY family protein [Deltaproteobacteria bacterium]